MLCNTQGTYHTVFFSFFEHHTSYITHQVQNSRTHQAPRVSDKGLWPAVCSTGRCDLRCLSLAHFPHSCVNTQPSGMDIEQVFFFSPTWRSMAHTSLLVSSGLMTSGNSGDQLFCDRGGGEVICCPSSFSWKQTTLRWPQILASSP